MALQTFGPILEIADALRPGRRVIALDVAEDHRAYVAAGLRVPMGCGPVHVRVHQRRDRDDARGVFSQASEACSAPRVIPLVPALLDWGHVERPPRVSRPSLRVSEMHALPPRQA